MKTYESYKESGVEWIGKIPKDWTNVRLKLISEISKGRKPKKDFEIFHEGLLPYMWMDYLRGKTSSPIYADASEENLVFVEEGDILILWDGSKAGEIVRAKKGVLSSTMAKIQINDERFDSDYLNYLLQLGQQHIQNNTVGMGIPHVSGNVLKDLMMLLPSLNEQSQISNYLDHKTQIIDALIEKKEQLIKKLHAQRQAIINEAVTKGLNPNAPMKDSGIEWLGEINSEWEIKRIKHTTYVKGRIGWQGLRSEDFREIGPYLVTGTDFIKGRIKWDTCHRVDEDRYEIDPNIQLLDDDVLITKDGTIGKIAIVKEKPDKVTLNTGVFVTRPLNKDYLQDYFYWLLTSDVFTHFIDFNKSGATIQHLYQNVFNEFSFALPSKLEKQRKIVSYLEVKTSKLDLLINKTKKQIKKLKAYRQSIISEAVTGKIDVRDWQPK